MDKVTGIKELGGTTFKTDKDIVNAEERAKMRQRMEERAMERTRERRRELSREKYLTRKKIEEAEKELEAHREREKEIDRAQEITRTRMLHQERRRQIEREKENEILFFKKVLGDKKINYDTYLQLKSYNIESALKDDDFIEYLKQYIANIDDKYEGISDERFYMVIQNKLNYHINKGVFADNLNYYTKLKGKTPRDIVKEFDLSYSTVSDWFNGVNYPRPDKISMLANFLGITPTELTEDRNKKADFIIIDSDKKLPAPTITEANNNIKVPVLGNIPAGIPNEAIEYIEDWEEIPASWVKSDKEYFALKIKGNSMYPDFKDGDVVIFQRASRCDNGKNCAVMIDNNDVTFKKLLQTEAGLILQPINDKEFDPIFYNKKQVLELNIKVIGIPKEIRRKLD